MGIYVNCSSVLRYGVAEPDSNTRVTNFFLYIFSFLFFVIFPSIFLKKMYKYAKFDQHVWCCNEHFH